MSGSNLKVLLTFARTRLPALVRKRLRRLRDRIKDARVAAEDPGVVAGRALVRGAVARIRARGPFKTPDGGPLAVLAYHPRVKTNPYQRMLYARCTSTGIVPVALSHIGGLAEAPQLVKLGAVPVLHIHWTHKILERATTEEAARAGAEAFATQLDTFKAAGGRVAWTLHNVLPHEHRFTEAEAAVCQALADHADAIHIMCDDTPDIAAEHYKLPADKLHLIPHASYLGVYPNYVSDDEARARLGLKPDQTVLTVFGGIRRYKGLDNLLDAFEVVSRADASLRLVLAGRPINLDAAELKARCDANPAIVTRFETIPDEDVQIYLNAADAVVLAHTNVLNSGLQGLAQAFARPVIAARTGCVTQNFDDSLGVLFEPEDRTSLERALAGAADLKAGKYRAGAREKAKRNSPDAMASAFAEMIRGIVR